MNTKNTTESKQEPQGRYLAAFLSLGVALGYLASAIAAANMPPALQADPNISRHDFWLVLTEDPVAHLAMHWGFVLAGLAGIGLVALLWHLRSKDNGPWFVIASAFALVGFAVLARSHLMEIEFDQTVLPEYAQADPAYQWAVQVVAGLALDVPDGVLTMGGIALWMAVAAASLRSQQIASTPFALVGAIAAASLLAGVIGYAVLNQALIVASFVGGYLIAGPIWHVWLAIILIRLSTRESKAPSQ